MTQSEAENQVRSAGIDISSSGRCSDRRRSTCTSLEQINCEAINCIVALKTSSGCSITITGGTVRSMNQNRVRNKSCCSRKLAIQEAPILIPMVTNSILVSIHASTRILLRHTLILVVAVMVLVNIKHPMVISLQKKEIIGIFFLLLIAEIISVERLDRDDDRSCFSSIELK